MTVGLDDGKVFLVDHWPGEVTNGPNPSAWTDQSATEDFPLGTKRQIYDDTNNGWAVLMYLYYTTGAGTVRAAKAGEPCGIDTTAMATAGQYCHVTNDGSDAQLLGPVAIALRTMTTARYAWFWVGGVAPVDTISALDGNGILTDGGVTAGTWLVLADSASLTKFHLGTATDAALFAAFAMAADSTS